MYTLPSMHLAVDNTNTKTETTKVTMQKPAKTKVVAPIVENVVHTERRVASNTFDSNIPTKNTKYATCRRNTRTMSSSVSTLT